MIPSGVTQNPLPDGPQNVGLIWSRRVQVDDTALYVCQAVNRNGMSTSSLKLSIVVPPTITSVFSTYPYFFLNSTTVSVPTNYREAVLTCLAYGSPAITSLSWVKITESGQKQIISDTTNRDSRLFVFVEIVFENGFQSSDAGNYSCIPYINDRALPHTAVYTITRGFTVHPVQCSVNTDVVYFEIRVLNTSCGEWDPTLKQLITFQILRSIKGILAVNCDECSVDDTNLVSNGLVMCSSKVEGAALFRGLISNSARQNIKNIFCALRNWQQVRPAIIINDSLRQVDRRCNLMMSSQNDLSGPECGFAVVESALTSTVAGSTSAVGLLALVALVGFVVFAQIIRTR